MGNTASAGSRQAEENTLMDENTPLENLPIQRPSTMAETAIEIATTTTGLAEWGALNNALKLVPVAQRIVIYRFIDGSAMWRHADESTLHIGTEKHETEQQLEMIAHGG
jgi:hypothetical protein